jgi:hypothetical protein
MGSMDDELARLARARTTGGRGPQAEYEYRVLTLPRGVSRAEARQLLTEHAEYGRWELAKVRLYLGGARRVWLRRRILRVQRSA